MRTLDYRLAPNIGLFREPTLGPAPGRFPAAHHDVIDVATALRAEGGVSVDIGGASAGANLAAGAVLAMRDGGMETPRSVVLAYGALHSAIPEDAQVESSLRGPLARWFFNPAMTRRMNVNYVGEVAGLVRRMRSPAVRTCTASRRRSSSTPATTGCAARAMRSPRAPERRLSGHEVVVKGRHGFLGSPRRAPFATGWTAIADWLRR